MWANGFYCGIYLRIFFFGTAKYLFLFFMGITSNGDLLGCWTKGTRKIWWPSKSSIYKGFAFHHELWPARSSKGSPGVPPASIWPAPILIRVAGISSNVHNFFVSFASSSSYKSWRKKRESHEEEAEPNFDEDELKVLLPQLLDVIWKDPDLYMGRIVSWCLLIFFVFQSVPSQVVATGGVNETRAAGLWGVYKWEPWRRRRPPPGPNDHPIRVIKRERREEDAATTTGRPDSSLVYISRERESYWIFTPIDSFITTKGEIFPAPLRVLMKNNVHFHIILSLSPLCLFRRPLYVCLTCIQIRFFTLWSILIPYMQDNWCTNIQGVTILLVGVSPTKSSWQHLFRKDSLWFQEFRNDSKIPIPF